MLKPDPFLGPPVRRLRPLRNRGSGGSRAVVVLILLLVILTNTGSAAITPRSIDSLFDSGDTTRLDAEIIENSFAAYQYCQQHIEEFFESKDTVLYERLSYLARGITRWDEDDFFQRQLTNMKKWQAGDYESRRILKKQFSDAMVHVNEVPTESVGAQLERITISCLEFGDSVLAVRAMQNAGELYSISFKSEKALLLLSKSLLISRSIGDRDAVGRTFYLMGNNYLRQQMFVRAGESFDSSRSVRAVLGDLGGQMNCLRSISNIYVTLGELEKAKGIAIEVLTWRRFLNDSLRISESMLDIVTLFSEQIAVAEVKSMIGEIATILRQIDAPQLQTRFLYALGIATECEGDIDSAVTLYRNALDESCTEKNSDLELSLLMRLASVGRSSGDNESSLKYNLEAQTLAQRSHNRAAEAVAFHNLGMTFQLVGNLESAASYYQRSLEIKRELGLHSQMGETLNNLAEIYLTANDTTTAEEYLSQSLKISQQYGNLRQKSDVRIATARLQRTKGRYASAFENLDSAFSYSVAVRDRRMQFDIALMRSEFSRLQGDLKRAQLILAGAGEMLERWESPYGRMKLEILQGEVLYDMKQWQAAYTHLASAIGYLEKTRRRISDPQLRSFQQSQSRRVYEMTASIWYNLYKETGEDSFIDSLLTYQQMAKSRTLLDLVRSLPTTLRPKIPRDLIIKENFLIREIEASEDKLMTADSDQEREAVLGKLSDLQLEMSEVRLRQSLADSLGERIFTPGRLSLSKLQNRLSDNQSCVLDFLLAPEMSILVVIESAQRRIFTLPARQEITKSVAEYLDLLRESKDDESLLDSVNLVAEQLSRVIFGDFASKVTRFSKLCVCPDGALSILPFEALRWDGDYLIERAEISLIPSLYLFTGDRQKQRDLNSAHLLAFADPESGAGEQQLPFSLKEVEWIAETFAPGNVKILSGRDSSEEYLSSAEAANYDYVHFATHSVINADNPPLSCLTLSPDSTSGKRECLYLSDVMRLSFSADLVVLSSCESGGGAIQLGEGIDGFARGFMYAGCRNVLVTYWVVRDFTAAEFMKSFYENLSLGYAGSLRAAKMKMIHSLRRLHRHPYYWAPFILIRGE